MYISYGVFVVVFFKAEDGIRDRIVTGVQTCALPIYLAKLEDLLEKRGYSAEDREKILHGNFVRFLREHLPA